MVDPVKRGVLTVLNSNEDKKQVNEVFESVEDPFVGIETNALQSNHSKQNFDHVEPKEVIWGKNYCEKRAIELFMKTIKSLYTFLY